MWSGQWKSEAARQSTGAWWWLCQPRPDCLKTFCQCSKIVPRSSFINLLVETASYFDLLWALQKGYYHPPTKLREGSVFTGFCLWYQVPSGGMSGPQVPSVGVGMSRGEWVCPGWVVTHPPCYRHLVGATIHTVDKRAVRILLECFPVIFGVTFTFYMIFFIKSSAHDMNCKKRMICIHCEEIIENRHHFRRHILTHPMVSYKPWKCPICDYRGMY